MMDAREELSFFLDGSFSFTVVHCCLLFVAVVVVVLLLVK